MPGKSRLSPSWKRTRPSYGRRTTPATSVAGTNATSRPGAPSTGTCTTAVPFVSTIGFA